MTIDARPDAAAPRPPAPAPAQNAMTQTAMTQTAMTQTAATQTATQQEGTTPASGRAQVWPLAPLQAGLLYHAVSSEGGLDVYSMQSTYAFEPGLDLGVLERACASLLRRHDALRAGFSAALLDRPVQFVPHQVALPWRMVDLTDRDEAAAHTAFEAIQVDERQRRFDMDAPPLIRFVCVDLGAAGVRLVLTNHHIVLDGWSDALLVVELLRHVSAGGCDRTLPEPPQFRDYLTWLGRRDAEADRAAWRHALSGLEAGSLLAEPDGEREAVLPDVVEIDLGVELTNAVRRFARGRAVSTNTVYSTVWGLLLGGLLGRDDVVFGTTVSGRPADLTGVDETVGLFLNTVPQRVRARAAESVADLVSRVQAEQAGLVEHHHVGLGDIQTDAGVGPLFDTLYVMRNTPTDDEAFDQLSRRVGLTDIDGGDATHYPATFIVHPDASTRLILSYRHDVLDEQRAGAVLASAVRVLTQLVDDPERPVGSLDLLAPGAAGSLVESWRGESRELPGTGLVELLARIAQRVPDRTALVDENGSLTFAQLWQAVQTQARALQTSGVAPGDLVAIELPRGREVVVAVFAVLAARAAYVPIDTCLPAARRQELREQARARCVLTPQTYADAARDTGTAAAEGICVGSGAGYRHDDLAYVMFTSGSSGAPKGVAIEHTGLVNMLHNHRRRIFAPAGADEGSPWRVAHSVSFAFDMSWEELLWLLDGHEVHLLSESVRRDPAAITEYLARHRIDVINVTPSVAGALLADGLLADDTPTPRLVLLGGEAVDAQVWSALRTAPRTQGYNLYGPTEYTINTLGGGTAESATPIVGRAVDNTDVRVLDPALRPVPDGVPGELYITGAGLARGYHDAPARTAQRFVADPYGPPGTRMYRTGDLVSRRADGVFDFHGRSDAQVKIRGHRVEPGEVQAVLAADPRVARCAVVARRLSTGTLALIGYVVPAPDGAGGDPQTVGFGDRAVEAVLSELRARLPEAMVPAALVAVDDLPLTVNSKLDVAALPLPTLTAGAGRAPRGPREEAVCEVFAQVLGLETVAADDHFFALGGHSLLAMRTVTLLRERLGRRVGVATLLAAPTPAGLVAALDGDHDPFAVVLPLGGRAGHGHAPVFCVHPMLGLGWTFSSFAARLRGRDGPAVYAVQSPALRDPDAAPADLAALAEHLVEAITAASAAAGDDLTLTGAHLVGWSFGGTLAHLMAARLAHQGVHVASLLLLDPAAPPRAQTGPRTVTVPGQGPADEEQDTQEVLGFLLAASLREVPDWMVPPYDVEETLEFLTEGTGAFSGLGADDLSAFVRAFTLNRRLLAQAPALSPIDTPTTLVVSTPDPGTPGDEEAHSGTEPTAWRALTRAGLVVHAVDIPHDLLTAPYAAERLAPLIRLSGTAGTENPR